MPGGRPPKKLLDHILERTFIASEHGRFIERAEDLPVRPPVPDPSPATIRIWGRLRAVQVEYREVSSVEVRRDLSLEFGRLVAEYAQAAHRSRRDPAKELDGLAEMLAAGRRARRLAGLTTQRTPGAPRGRTLGPYVSRFLANFRHTKGPAAGTPFQLEPWQQHDIDLMYELLPRGRRRWRSILYGVARGNGKSPIVGGLGLVEVAAREDEPEVFTAGTDRDGAKIIHDFQVAFATGSALGAHCDVLQKAITYRPTGGVVRTLSGDGYRAHGLTPSTALKDEKHAWLTDKQVELHWALESGMHKRFDSVSIDITTAGWDQATLLGQQYEANLQTMELELLEDGFLVVGRDAEAQSLMIWRGAPEDADPTDPAVWRRANPASWLPDAELKRLAMTLPENIFRRLILNQWTEALVRWLPVGIWERLVAKRELADGEPVVLVFTGTYQRESAALVACTTEGKPHVAVLGLWERPAGAEGWTVPVNEVDRAVRQALRRLDVLELICDRPGWEDECEDWADRYGSVVGFPLERNRRRQMVAAGARFYSLIAEGGLSHDGNRALAKQLAQVQAREVPEGVLLARPLGSDRRPAAGRYIDAAVAAVVAVEGAANGEPSVYETRGLTTLEELAEEDSELEALTVDGETIYVKRAS